jgi:hypothetical protein
LTVRSAEAESALDCPVAVTAYVPAAASDGTVSCAEEKLPLESVVLVVLSVVLPPSTRLTV